MELLADRDPEEARKLLDPVLEQRTRSLGGMDASSGSNYPTLTTLVLWVA
jgi:hypothetical protein